MAFWSSQRLERELSLLIGHNRLDAVDCNAITMRVGGEVNITPGLEEAAPIPTPNSSSPLTARSLFRPVGSPSC